MTTREAILILLALLLAMCAAHAYFEARWCAGEGAYTDACLGCADDCLEAQ